MIAPKIRTYGPAIKPLIETPDPCELSVSQGSATPTMVATPPIAPNQTVRLSVFGSINRPPPAVHGRVDHPAEVANVGSASAFFCSPAANRAHPHSPKRSRPNSPPSPFTPRQAPVYRDPKTLAH